MTFSEVWKSTREKIERGIDEDRLGAFAKKSPAFARALAASPEGASSVMRSQLDRLKKRLPSGPPKKRMTFSASSINAALAKLAKPKPPVP